MEITCRPYTPALASGSVELLSLAQNVMRNPAYHRRDRRERWGKLKHRDPTSNTRVLDNRRQGPLVYGGRECDPQFGPRRLSFGFLYGRPFGNGTGGGTCEEC